MIDRYIGTWYIDDMEHWSDDYFTMDVQANIAIRPHGRGDVQCGLVRGHIDGEIVTIGRSEPFEFTWEGQDEMEPVRE